MTTLVDFSALIESLCEQIDSTLNVALPALSSEARFLERVSMRTEPQPHENLTKFIYFLHNIPGYDPSYFQKLIFAMASRVFSEKIMKGATPQQQISALDRHGLDPIDSIFCMAETGRRSGKTDAATQIVAGAMAALTNINIIYVSLHVSTCRSACDTTYRWLHMAGLAQKYKKTTLAIETKTSASSETSDVCRVQFMNAHNPQVKNIFLSFLLYYH